MRSPPPPSGESKAGKTSWLCRDDFDRERMLDMEARFRPVRRRAFAIIAVAIAAVGPWLGWWPLLFLLPASFCFAAADKLVARLERPEFLIFGAWIGGELAIAGALMLEGGAGSYARSWLAIPVITLSSRFSMRGVVAGVTIAVLLVLAVAFGADASNVIQSPDVVIAPFALILCVAVLSIPLMRSDIQHRNDSVIDQLTGMLNRKALNVRVQELTQQSEVTGAPIGMIIGDLDHFKRVNDSNGHAVGDAVLKETAYLLRKQLRAFDLAYRLGGEEFLILLPGSNLEQSVELADRLRQAIGADRVAGGLAVTMSFGVAASERAETFDYGAVFATADEALYRAKRGGRDRVCIAGCERDAVLV